MDRILERKYRAVDSFKQRLLRSSVGDKIGRIILFGSLLRKDAGKESDIDLLIVATDDIKKVEEMTAEISFDILLEMGEGVEPLVYCLDRLRYPDSYFLFWNFKPGKEIYRMDDPIFTMERE